MKKNDVNILDIGVYGLATVIRLIEVRVNYDIVQTVSKQESKTKQVEGLKSATKGFALNLRTNRAENKAIKLDLISKRKKQWLDLWCEKAWQALSQVGHSDITIDLRNKSLQQLLNALSSNEETRIKLFLVLQEAVLTDVYGNIEGFSDRNLSEHSVKKSCELIADQCGFSPSVGNKILQDAGSFFKGVTGYYKKITTWTLAGTIAMLVTAGLAAPAIATTIGGIMGFHGAAAYTAGLAFIGTGSIAAGGLGMAGGLQILTLGGFILGLAGTPGLVKTLLGIKKEAIYLEMAKIINYASYLKSIDKKSVTVNETLNQLINQFITFKHSYEKDVFWENLSNKDLNEAKKYIRTIHYTYEYLVDKIR